jgi:hypothetical protein
VSRQLATQEILNRSRNFLRIGFEGEVAGVLEMYLGIWVVQIIFCSTAGESPWHLEKLLLRLACDDTSRSRHLIVSTRSPLR